VPRIDPQLKADTITRARELRAQGLMYQDIKAQLEREGLHPFSVPRLCQYCKDINSPQENRGRAPIYTTPEEQAEAQRQWARTHYYKHKERYRAEAAEQRAQETPEERADRLEYQRLKWRAAQERKSPEQLQREKAEHARRARERRARKANKPPE